MHQKDSRLSLKLILLVFVGLTFAQTIIHFVALLVPSIQQDDYNFFWWPKSNEFLSHPQGLTALLFGRPIAFLHLNFLKEFIETPSDHQLVRWLPIFYASTFGTVVSFFFLRINPSKRLGIFLGFGAICIPGTLSFVNLIQMSHNLFALLLSSVSVIIIHSMTTSKAFPNRSLRIFLYSSIAMILLVTSAFTYIAATPFAFSLVAGAILFSSNSAYVEKRRFVVAATIFILSGLLLFFVFHRFIFLTILSNQYPEALHIFSMNAGMYSFSVTSSPLVKLSFFLFDLTVKASNIWWAYVSTTLSITVIAFIFTAAICSFASSRRTGSKGIFCQAVIMLSILAALCNLPNLAAEGGFGFYRTLIPYSFFFMCLVTWATLYFNRMIKMSRSMQNYFAVFSFFVVLLSAKHLMFTSQIGNFTEWNFVRTQIANTAATKSSTVLFIKPDNGKQNRTQLGYPQINDEFNFSTTIAYPLMVNSILHFGNNRENFGVFSDEMPFVMSISPRKIIYMPKDTIVINMQGMRPAAPSVVSIDQYEIAFVDASSTNYGPYYGGGFVPANAFYDNTDLAWQSMPGVPQTLSVEYQKPFSAKSYSISASYLQDHTPKSWVLEASNDGETWLSLDKRTDESKWKKHEVRNFRMKTPLSHKFIRFRFLEIFGPALHMPKITFDNGD